MATVKLILNRYRVLKNGAYPLVFQLIHRRQKKLIYTSYKLLEDEFDSRKQDVRFISKAVRSNKREVGKLNRELRQIQGDLDNYIATLEARRKPYTVSDIVMRSHLRTWHRELILERRGCTQMGRVGHPLVRYETLPQVHGPKVRPRHQEAERGRTLYGSGCRRIRVEPGNFPQVPARARAGTVRHARYDQAGEWEDSAAPQHGEICRGCAAEEAARTTMGGDTTTRTD